MKPILGAFIVGFFTVTANAAYESSACSWKLPTVDDLEFSAKCELASGSSVSLRRELCVDALPKRPQNIPSDELITRTEVVNGVTLYTATGTYSPGQVGLYFADVHVNGTDVPSPQVISPIITISAMRKPRMYRDYVKCTVIGIYMYGELIITADDKLVMTADAGYEGWQSRSNKQKMSVEYVDGNMVFTVNLWTMQTETTYRCEFKPFRCPVSGYSKQFVIGHKRISMTVQYDDGVENPWPTRATGVCCRLTGPVVKNLTWVASSNCDNPQPLTSYTPPESVSFGRGYMTRGELSTSFISSGPRWNDGMGYVSHCVQTMYEGNSLPEGLYQCIMETDTGRYYEKSVHLQRYIDISLTRSESGILITCEFDIAGLGRLDVERIDDGYTMFSTGLSYSARLSLDSFVKVVETGPRMSISIPFTEDSRINSTFRCRVKNRCSTASSVGRSLLDNIRQTTPEPVSFKKITPKPTPESHLLVSDNQKTVAPDKVSVTKMQDLSRNSSSVNKRPPHEKNDVQRWTLATCMILGFVLTTATILAWFN